MTAIERRLFGALGRLFRVYVAMLRVRVLLPDGSVIKVRDYPHRSEIFAISERDLLAAGGLPTGGCIVLIAPGRDGDRAAAAAEGCGHRVVRGAARRGGATALRTLTSTMRADPRPAALAVDGPLGPVDAAKGGVIMCAAHTGRAVRALAASASRSIVFGKSWSRMYLPLPAARVLIALAEPLTAPPSITRDEIDALAQDVSRSLVQLRARAGRVVSARSDGERAAALGVGTRA